VFDDGGYCSSLHELLFPSALVGWRRAVAGVGLPLAWLSMIPKLQNRGMVAGV
jgi:hypothetical protein